MIFYTCLTARVVSGEEQMRKPDPRFYKLLLERYELNVNEVLFIDDNLRNVHGGGGIGYKKYKV
jgi:2-haloacid dehalogenase